MKEWCTLSFRQLQVRWDAFVCLCNEWWESTPKIRMQDNWSFEGKCKRDFFIQVHITRGRSGFLMRSQTESRQGSRQTGERKMRNSLNPSLVSCHSSYQFILLGNRVFLQKRKGLLAYPLLCLTYGWLNQVQNRKVTATARLIVTAQRVCYVKCILVSKTGLAP